MQVVDLNMLLRMRWRRIWNKLVKLVLSGQDELVSLDDPFFEVLEL